jgi:hypothetical protein
VWPFGRTKRTSADGNFPRHGPSCLSLSWQAGTVNWAGLTVNWGKLADTKYLVTLSLPNEHLVLYEITVDQAVEFSIQWIIGSVATDTMLHYLVANNTIFFV